MKKLWENRSLIVFVIVVTVGAYTVMKGVMLGICWLVDKVADFLRAYRRKNEPIIDLEDDLENQNSVVYGEKG